MESNQKFKVVFSDGTEVVKTRWDIAVFSRHNPRDFSEVDGIIKYEGQDYNFIAYPLED